MLHSPGKHDQPGQISDRTLATVPQHPVDPLLVVRHVGVHARHTRFGTPVSEAYDASYPPASTQQCPARITLASVPARSLRTQHAEREQIAEHRIARAKVVDHHVDAQQIRARRSRLLVRNAPAGQTAAIAVDGRLLDALAGEKRVRFAKLGRDAQDRHVVDEERRVVLRMDVDCRYVYNDTERPSNSGSFTSGGLPQIRPGPPDVV